MTTIKPAKIAPAIFAIGDRVTCTMPSLSSTPLVGTISNTTASGWYAVLLDVVIDAIGVKDGKISCRARSLEALLVEAKPQTKAESSDEEIDDSDEEIDKEEVVGSKMAQALAKARTHYTKCRRPNGAQTAHSGDDVAKALHDYEPMEVAALADRCLNQPSGTHLLKYGHLNNGQIRMNSGNRIRAAFLKAIKEEDKATLLHICTVLGLDEESDADEESSQD